MKPSGIEWIGDIPDDWEVRKLLSLFKEHKDRNKNLEEQNLLSLSYGKIKRKDINNNDGLLPASFETYNIVEKGDIVFRLTDLQNDKRSLRTGIVTQRGIITSAYVTIRPKIKLDSRFYHYLYHMYDICKVFYGMGDGVRQGMGFEELKNIPTLIPPLKTQQKISDYLDEKCGKIDATIAKQKESIEKLKAYKQSLISETVTKGLDKFAPLKPSGIDYLGDIPSHWEIKKLKYVSKLDPTISEFLRDNDIVSFAPMECLGEQTLSPYETEYGKVKGKYTYFANEDIIMAKVTPCFENGNIAIARNLKNNVGFGSSELFVFRTKSVSNSFLMYALYSEPFKSLAKSTMYGTGGLKRVSPNFILNYKIPLPPLKTQESIADYLDSKCSQIDKYITEKQNIIQKLDAYKKSLIFECVTGKRDLWV